MMPIHYTIDARSGYLLTRADGVVTFDELNAHLDVEQRNRDLRRPELFDASGATTNVTAAQVRLLVQRSTSMLRVVDVGPTAIVTTDDVAYGMARMYSILAEGAGVNAEVFRDVRSANLWLQQFDHDSD